MNYLAETTTTTRPTTTPTTMCTTTPHPTNSPSGIVCSDDWSEFGGECYKYFDNSDNWEDAKEHCVSEEVLMILF